MALHKQVYQHAAGTAPGESKQKDDQPLQNILARDVQIPPPVSINNMFAARQVHCLADVSANSGTKKLRQAVISRDSRNITFCLPIPSKDICNSFRALQILVTCIFFQALCARCPIWKPLLDKWVNVSQDHGKPELQGLGHHSKWQGLRHSLAPATVKADKQLWSPYHTERRGRNISKSRWQLWKFSGVGRQGALRVCLMHILTNAATTLAIYTGRIRTFT